MEPSQWLLSAVLGLFGGAGATLSWELLVQPRRLRRRLARLLIAEILCNRLTIENERNAFLLQPDRPPKYYMQFLTSAYENSQALLAELPVELVGEIHWAYRYFYELKQSSARFWDFVARMQDSGSTSHLGEWGIHARESHRTYLENALVFTQRAIRVLEYASLPPWSARRRALKATVAGYRGGVVDIDPEFALHLRGL